MKKYLLLFCLFLCFQNVFAQKSDSLSYYHKISALSDSSFSIIKENGDSTVVMFEGKSGGSSDHSKINLQDVTNNGNTSTNKINIANLKLSNIPTFSNQDDAIQYGLKKGDIYKLPVDRNNNSLLAIVEKSQDSSFTLYIDNSNNNTHLKFLIEGNRQFQMTVDWGDGTQETYSNNTGYLPEHFYDSARTYEVSFQFDDHEAITAVIIGIDFSPTCNVTSFRNAHLFTNIVTFDIEGTPMKYWNYTDGFAPTLNITWYIHNNFDSEELNKLLMYFDSLEFNPGPKYLYIFGQQTQQVPTGPGLAAISSLQAKGWVISY